MWDDSDALIARLLAIESRFAGDGEPVVALRARLEQLRATEHEEGEFRLTVSDEWAQHLFEALCRRYGLEPYRYRGQRKTTAMVQAPRTFVEQVLWPEFEAFQSELRRYVDAVTGRVIRAAVYDGAAPPGKG